MRLKHAYYIALEKVIKDDNGEVVELRCKYDPESRGGGTPDGRRVKGTLHWVSARHAMEAEVRLYDRLFNDPDPAGHKDKTPVDFTAKEAIRTRTMWLLVAYGTMSFLAMNGLMPIQIDFLLDIGLSDYKASAVVGVFSAVMAISQLGIGFLGLRFKMHSLAVVSIFFAIIGFAFLMFSDSMLLAIIYCIFLGIGFAIYL